MKLHCKSTYLLLLAGVYKSHGESSKSLWNAETDGPIFWATMSQKPFCCISRLDNKNNRQERTLHDKLTSVRHFWEKWVEMLLMLYNAGEYMSSNEQLVDVPSNGLCQASQQNMASGYGRFVQVLISFKYIREKLLGKHLIRIK